MMDAVCPQCDHTLEWDGQYYCVLCQVHYKKIVYCPDCAGELEKLQACGAASYFCNQCNELKSKSRVRIEFHKID
ncbi:DNA ligase [Vibrio cincinnatiensis]|nr:DNA ligase [Vibrio cincinnatiensis]